VVKGVPLYCKIDIEGNDHLCLAGMRPDFRPAFVSVEITPRELEPQPLLEALSGLGYDRFKVIHQLSFTVPQRGWYVARQAGVVRLGKAFWSNSTACSAAIAGRAAGAFASARRALCRSACPAGG
jgi:hypothetical protein